MLEGYILNERYEILNTIGGGGMAKVYLGYDRILKREVAIKVLRLEYANDPEFIARFEREVQTATSLSHPNIVNIYDVGEEEQILYMVMEYVKGPTLKEYIQTNGPLQVDEALDIMKQITKAIHYAHTNNLIHRDIKPQNILINEFGKVKVTDFGIALALSATSLTETNSIMGSVHYLSPEQAHGKAATKKSDIYSLGIVFYEMLTTKLPFDGHSPVAIALKHLQNAIPSIRKEYTYVPQSVENIVLKATAKDPLQRYHSVCEMEIALNDALDESKKDEPKFIERFIEDDEATKKIPVIREEHFQNTQLKDTIIHKGRPDKKKNIIKKNQKPNIKKRLFIKVSLFILVVSLIFILFIFPHFFKTKDVTIPDITNMDLEKAVEILEQNSLQTEIDKMYSSEIAKNNVIKTEPNVNRTVKENSTVKVYVSEGEETLKMLNYVGQPFQEVKTKLENIGFKEIILEEKFSYKSKGEIIEQVQPLPGEKVKPNETTVIFHISTN